MAPSTKTTDLSFTFTIIADGFTAGSVVKDFCDANGLAYECETNSTIAKKVRSKRRKQRRQLNAEEAAQLRAARKKNPRLTYAKLAKRFGISESAAHRIVNDGRRAKP